MPNTQGTFLAYRNWIENKSATLTTGAEEQGARLVTNLQTIQGDDFWRVGNLSPGLTTASVTVELPADKSGELITLQFPRGTYPGVSEDEPSFSDSDTIRVRLFDEFDAVQYDSGVNPAGVVPGYMTYYDRLDAAVAFRKITVDFDAPSRGAAGFFDVSNLGVWPVFEPNIGLAYPASFGWTTNKVGQKTPAGRLYTARFEPKRKWALVFDSLSNDESMEIDEMIRFAGGARQIFARRGDLPVGKDAMLATVTGDNDVDSVTAALRQGVLALEEFI